MTDLLLAFGVLALAVTFGLHLWWFHKPPPKKQGCTDACSEMHTFTWPCEQAVGTGRYGKG